MWLHTETDNDVIWIVFVGAYRSTSVLVQSAYTSVAVVTTIGVIHKGRPHGGGGVIVQRGQKRTRERESGRHFYSIFADVLYG